MSAATFPLRVITPQRVFVRDVTGVRLRDRTGLFGVMRGHADFLTVLESSLGSYRTADGQEVFLAVDGGIFSVEGGRGTICSAEVFEGPDAIALAGRIEQTRARREESERIFSLMIEGLGREFMEKTLSFIQRRPG
jgi:F-type H+-transporting ATPase subunit epsilon